MSIQGVIFDIDGTLLDSNDAHADAWKRAIESHGFRTTWEEIRHAIGMGGDHLLPALLGIEKDDPLGKAISALKARIFFEEYLPQLRPFPKARELVQEVHHRGRLTAVATSADRSELNEYLDRLGIRNVIDVNVSADDAARSKPDPDVVLAALEKLELPPEEVIMIGDTPYDLEAAQKAGVKSIAVRTGRWKDADLRPSIAIYDSVGDLLERIDRSPLAGGTRPSAKPIDFHPPH